LSINPKAKETVMSSKFEEVVTIKAPRGTRAALQELADRKYIASGTLARQMLMEAIEAERRKQTKVAA
jgi:predicted transcriptional regulator